MILIKEETVCNSHEGERWINEKSMIYLLKTNETYEENINWQITGSVTRSKGAKTVGNNCLCGH